MFLTENLYRCHSLWKGCSFIFQKCRKCVSDRSNHQGGVRLTVAVLHTHRVLHCNLVTPCLARGWYKLTFLPTPPRQVHTQLHDAYLRQEQLTLNEITLSLTHKGQADHSLAKTLPLLSRPSVCAALLPLRASCHHSFSLDSSLTSLVACCHWHILIRVSSFDFCCI